MIEVNVSNLKTNVKELEKSIKTLEEIKLNMFNQLEDSCVNWHDGHSLVFNGKMLDDSHEADKILLNLKQKRDLYDYITIKYGEIGSIIKCNFESEENLNSKITECINSDDEVLQELTNIHFDVYPTINQLFKSKETINNFKTSIKNILIQIRENEQSIGKKIDELDLIKIEPLDFDISTDVGE